VNSGQFPVVRGHILDEEDLLLRRHIHALMCGFKTSLSQSDEANNVIAACLQRLAELEKDGLVHITEDAVSVTVKGRPFIRNICLCTHGMLRWE